MPSPNEPVNPTPFEPAAVTQDASEQAGVKSNTWIVPSLVVLCLVALLVFFWLPEYVDSRAAGGEKSADSNPPTSSANNTQDEVATPKPQPTQKQNAQQAEQTPWADAQQARLRLEAQNILAELLELQFSLEESQVELWGPNEFAAAAVAAEKGDVAYRERDYENAIAHYQEGLSTLEQLRDARPEILEGFLVSAENDLQEGDPKGALDALANAAAIDPTHPTLVPLEQRARILPQVLSLLEQAQEHEEAGDLDTASSLLTEAAALDPLHKTTTNTLERVNASLRDQRFQEAMSRGYLALSAGKLNDALKEFKAAQAIDKTSAVASNAIIEVENARTTNTLAALQQQGLAYENKEQWSSAVTTYKKALGMDANLTYAREGLARSTSRDKLDRNFKSIVAEPDRLSDTRIALDAQEFLEAMRATEPKGDVLRSQIAELDKLLVRARTPVNINLVSDEQTDVVVYKVARLGKFKQHNMELRPGVYVAVGTRTGFRDVRKEISVRPEDEAKPISIICTEPI